MIFLTTGRARFYNKRWSYANSLQDGSKSLKSLEEWNFLGQKFLTIAVSLKDIELGLDGRMESFTFIKLQSVSGWEVDKFAGADPTPVSTVLRKWVRVFIDKYIFMKKTFRVKNWPMPLLNDSETQKRALKSKNQKPISQGCMPPDPPCSLIRLRHSFRKTVCIYLTSAPGLLSTGSPHNLCV